MSRSAQAAERQACELDDALALGSLAHPLCDVSGGEQPARVRNAACFRGRFLGGPRRRCLALIAVVTAARGRRDARGEQRGGDEPAAGADRRADQAGAPSIS